MNPTLLDNFTGSDGSIDGRTVSAGGYTWDAPQWTGQTAAPITSNAINGSATVEHSAVLNSSTWGPDVEVGLTLTAWASGADIYISARMSNGYGPTFPDTYGSGDQYVLLVSPNGTSTYALKRDIGGSGTTIVDGGTGWTTGDLQVGDKVGFSLVEEGGSTRCRVFRTASGVWTEDRNALDSNASRPTGAGYLSFELNPTAAITIDDFSARTTSGGQILLPDADTAAGGWGVSGAATRWQATSDSSDSTYMMGTAS